MAFGPWVDHPCTFSDSDTAIGPTLRSGLQGISTAQFESEIRSSGLYESFTRDVFYTRAELVAAGETDVQFKWDFKEHGIFLVSRVDVYWVDTYSHIGGLAFSSTDRAGTSETMRCPYPTVAFAARVYYGGGERLQINISTQVGGGAPSSCRTSPGAHTVYVLEGGTVSVDLIAWGADGWEIRDWTRADTGETFRRGSYWGSDGSYRITYSFNAEHSGDVVFVANFVNSAKTITSVNDFLEGPLCKFIEASFSSSSYVFEDTAVAYKGCGYRSFVPIAAGKGIDDYPDIVYAGYVAPLYYGTIPTGEWTDGNTISYGNALKFIGPSIFPSKDPAYQNAVSFDGREQAYFDATDSYGNYERYCSNDAVIHLYYFARSLRFEFVGGSGTVLIENGENNLAQSARVGFKAIPDDGYEFVCFETPGGEKITEDYGCVTGYRYGAGKGYGTIGNFYRELFVYMEDRYLNVTFHPSIANLENYVGNGLWKVHVKKAKVPGAILYGMSGKLLYGANGALLYSG